MVSSSSESSNDFSDLGVGLLFGLIGLRSAIPKDVSSVTQSTSFGLHEVLHSYDLFSPSP